MTPQATGHARTPLPSTATLVARATHLSVDNESRGNACGTVGLGLSVTFTWPRYVTLMARRYRSPWVAVALPRHPYCPLHCDPMTEVGGEGAEWTTTTCGREKHPSGTTGTSVSTASTFAYSTKVEYGSTGSADRTCSTTSRARTWQTSSRSCKTKPAFPQREHAPRSHSNLGDDHYGPHTSTEIAAELRMPLVAELDPNTRLEATPLMRRTRALLTRRTFQ
jgi:hypothetical protein